ncbi:MAG: hypothetical protein MJD61_07030 [Proteobacteria bacterium]|nr:hypothetical protein [Pseudomonadota bacterium]
MTRVAAGHREPRVELGDLRIFPERSRLDRAMETLRSSHQLVRQVLSGKR